MGQGVTMSAFVLQKRDCHDCGAKPGELHDPGCDEEQCPKCGFQMVSCGHFKDWPAEAERLPWLGHSKLGAEAVEYGWFIWWDERNRKWVPCGPEHPEARPNRSRVADECVWDPIQRKFMKTTLYVVRFYDGMDNVWMNVSCRVTKEEATRLWNEKTDNGKRNTKFADIDYYAIFPADTVMLYRDKSEGGLGGRD